MTLAIKAALNTSTQETAPRVSSTGADPSTTQFRDSLRNATSNTQLPGSGSRVSSDSGTHSHRKPTDTESSTQQPEQPVQTAPLVADLSMPVEVVASQLPAAVQNIASPPSLATLSAQLPETSSRSRSSTDDITVDQSLPTKQAASLDISTQVDPSATTKDIPSAMQPVGDTSASMPGQQPGDSSQPSLQNTPAPDPSQDPILSAIRAAVFASPVPTAAPLTQAAPAIARYNPPAIAPNVATSLPVASISQTTADSTQVGAVARPLSAVQMPVVHTSSAQPNLPSSAGSSNLKKAVTNVKTSAKVIANAPAAPGKADTSHSSDAEAPQQANVISADTSRDTTSPQQTSLGSTAASEVDLPGMPSQASSTTPHDTTTAIAKPQTALQPEQLISVGLPAADSTLALNSVRLMQRVGQAEMTIGMHSTEFGSISIRTSNIRDQVAAVVSLDHTELSKAILLHLPEMQSKLNGDRPLDLRITTPGSAESFSQGSSSGDTSQEGGQRTPHGLSSQNFSNSKPTQQVKPAVTLTEFTRTTSNSSRLDVRV